MSAIWQRASAGRRHKTARQLKRPAPCHGNGDFLLEIRTATVRADGWVLDQGIDTSTAVGRMFFQILGAVAEFEHAPMSERTMDGLAAARARGRTGGQKPKLTRRQARIGIAPER